MAVPDVAGQLDLAAPIPFLPEAWAHGYAAQAYAAALGWFAGALPGAPVVLCTRTANDRSMRLAAKPGFNEVQRYEEWGAEQWFGAPWSPVTPPGALSPNPAAPSPGVPADHAHTRQRLGRVERCPS
jgi:hypothetical protein